MALAVKVGLLGPVFHISPQQTPTVVLGPIHLYSPSIYLILVPFSFKERGAIEKIHKNSLTYMSVLLRPEVLYNV